MLKASDRRKLLIVDDDSIIRQTLRILLRNNGFEVVGEAGDGMRAMEMIEKHKPNIVLLDITMPGTSGLEVLEEIKEKYPKIKVVMISGEASSDVVKQCIVNGAVGYIVKPFSTANVVQNLQRAGGPISKSAFLHQRDRCQNQELRENEAWNR